MRTETTEVIFPLSKIRPSMAEMLFVIHELGVLWLQHFSPQEQRLLKLYYGKRLTFEQIGQRFQLPPKQIYALYKNCVHAFQLKAAFAFQRYKDLAAVQSENARLKQQVMQLRDRLDIAEHGCSQQVKDPALLKRSIALLDINPRYFNILRKAGIQTIGELLHWTQKDLLRIRNVGGGTIRELQIALEKIGLGLREY